MAKKTKEVKITTTVEALVAAINASAFERGKNQLPVLGFVYLKGDTLIGTDLGQTSLVPIKCKGNGDVLIPAAQALNVLKGEKGPLTVAYLPDDSERKVRFTAGSYEFTLRGHDRANFPATPPAAKPALLLDGKKFSRAIENVLFPISKEESRYTLNGALIEAKNGTVSIVATDGHRLSLVTMEEPGELRTMLPRAALLWFKANMGEAAEIGVDAGPASTIAITTGNKTLISRRLKGDFPDYTKVMPKAEDLKISARFVDPTVLAKAVERVLKCADERSKAVRVAFTPGSTELYANSSERGEARVSIPCSTEGINGSGKFSAGYSGVYLQDFLKQTGDHPFQFTVRDNQSAALLIAEDFKYILMPMRM